MMRDGGRIINISSGVTWFTVPEIFYSMTKGALNVFSRSLAHTQGARGITANTVSPGITETDMNSWLAENPESPKRVASVTALGRHGQPADIADAVASSPPTMPDGLPGRRWRSMVACSWVPLGSDNARHGVVFPGPECSRKLNSSVVSDLVADAIKGCPRLRDAGTRWVAVKPQLSLGRGR